MKEKSIWTAFIAVQIAWGFASWLVLPPAIGLFGAVCACAALAGWIAHIRWPEWASLLAGCAIGVGIWFFSTSYAHFPEGAEWLALFWLAVSTLLSVTIRYFENL